MSTDPEQQVAHTADRQLQELDKKYPGFLQMKALSGIKLSYTLQKTIQSNQNGPLRGFRPPPPEGGGSSALNAFVYSLLRVTKQQRRAVILSTLKNFDESSVSTILRQFPFMF